MSGVMGLLVSCYPAGPEYVEDYDIVVTNYNDEYDFQSKGTYAMPDRIVKITGNLVEGDTPEYIDDIYGDQILARIDQNLQDLGWTKVDVSANPDVLITPAAWETTTVYYYYDYWYWWYGGYYGWCCYYPYYPPVSYTSITTGTLFWSMLDPDQEGVNGNPVPQWTAAINGILRYAYNAETMNRSIDQAFAQSSYIKTN
jgi:hypothetical protein